MTAGNDEHPASELFGNGESIDHIIAEIEHAGTEPQISVADVLDALGTRSFAPMLLVPALIALSPLSGIIGVSSFCGLWIAAVSVQLLLRRDHVWLPQWMQRRSVSRERVRQAVSRLRGPAHWIDRHTGKRITFVVGFPFNYLVAAIILSLGMAMPFLEFVPFSGSMAGLSVALLALGLLYRDSVLVLAGLTAAIGVATLIFFVGRTVGEIINQAGAPTVSALSAMVA
ncbi:MAG: exopolysaccharide biosynthesis protein [Pseudomonadota bacterium]